jgi:hypothetical protein
MKNTIAPLAFASALAAGAAQAQDAPLHWEHEAEPTAPLSTFDHPARFMPPPPPQTYLVGYPSFPYRPWMRGERQRYEPSTVGTYEVRAAPANNCGPALFEVANPGPGESTCVARYRRSASRQP